MIQWFGSSADIRSKLRRMDVIAIGKSILMVFDRGKYPFGRKFYIVNM